MSGRRRGSARSGSNQTADEGVDPAAYMWAQMMQQHQAMQQHYQD